MLTVEKRRQFIINVVYFVLVSVLAVVIVRFALGYLMPFIVGFVVAFLLKPLVTRLTSKFGENTYIRMIVVALFYLVIGVVIFGLIVFLIGFSKNSYASIKTLYVDTLLPTGLNLYDNAKQQIGQLTPEVQDVLLKTLDSLINVGKNLVSSISGTLIATVSSIPSLLISILIAIIASIFFTLDYQNIVANTFNVLPKRWSYLIIEVKNTFMNTIGKYLIAYGKLITLTFAELSLGFLLIGIKNPFGLAFLIAVVDILPVLGTGTIMIPWFIAEFILGNPTMGFSLLALYLIITIIRNILEPKVVGAQIGLHPLLTLICIYVGMKLAGFAGLFGLPIAVVILKTMHEQGKITFFNQFLNTDEKHDA